MSGWVNNRMTGDLRRRRPNYDAAVMISGCIVQTAMLRHLGHHRWILMLLCYFKQPRDLWNAKRVKIINIQILIYVYNVIYTSVLDIINNPITSNIHHNLKIYYQCCLVLVQRDPITRWDCLSLFNYPHVILCLSSRTRSGQQLMCPLERCSSSCNQLLVAFREYTPLQWCHNERGGVSYHQPHHWLLNRLLRRRSMKISKFRVTGLCAGNSPVTGEFPAQRASYAEKFPFDDVIMVMVRMYGIYTNDPCIDRSIRYWRYGMCIFMLIYLIIPSSTHFDICEEQCASVQCIYAVIFGFDSSLGPTDFSLM